jgi:hypothetical protein
MASFFPFWFSFVGFVVVIEFIGVEGFKKMRGAEGAEKGERASRLIGPDLEVRDGWRRLGEPKG